MRRSAKFKGKDIADDSTYGLLDCNGSFGLEIVTQCPGVPSEMLIPRNVWPDREFYDADARKLANLFKQNFAKYEGATDIEIRAVGPVA